MSLSAAATTSPRASILINVDFHHGDEWVLYDKSVGVCCSHPPAGTTRWSSGSEGNAAPRRVKGLLRRFMEGVIDRDELMIRRPGIDRLSATNRRRRRQRLTQLTGVLRKAFVESQ